MKDICIYVITISKNNNIHGNGYMIWKNSFEKYLGQWVNNSQNGFGVHVWYEHKGEQKFWRNRYVGEMKNSHRNGYGVFFYANGGRYEGMWENNMKNGFGIFTAHDGTQTIGKYINDRFDSSMPVNVQGANTTKTSNLNGTNNKLFGKGGKYRHTQKGVLQAVNEEEETESIIGQNNTKGGTENNTNNNGISNKNEINETGIIKQKNDSALMSLSMIDSKSVLNNINSKMMELNPFKSLLELSDIIEIDPDVEANIMDIQNLLLRHLSEMKYWYKFYVYNRDTLQFDLVESSPLPGHKLSKQYNEKLDKEALHEVINKEQINEPVIDNNDFGYAMEMKDLWRFMRESFIVSSDFTLASFNRIFFRGPKNYIEMFHYPEDIKMYSDEFFEYMFQLIGKSKDDFSFKHRDKLKIHASVFSGPNELGNLLIKPSEADNLFDIHNKRNNILLRQFYEAIIRIAYLKYNHLPETLQKKIKMLIDLIKTNPNFKKLGKKSNTQYTNDSSMNSTICVLDLKVRVLESNAEQFSKIYDRSLKTIFNNLFQKSSYSYKKNDKTITNRFFYQNLIKKSNLVNDIIDKYKFYEFLTIYHKDKIILKEENRGSLELNKSIEIILNNEMIYYEHCELLYLCCRFYLLHNNIPDRIDNYNDLVNQFLELSKTSELVFQTETYQYNYPKLRNHKILDNMIETENQRKLEEEKKRMLLKKLENERSMMVIEDVDVLGQGDEEEENDYSDDSNPF